MPRQKQTIRLMAEYIQGDHIISAYDDDGQIARAVHPVKDKALAKARRRAAEFLDKNEADLRFIEWDIANSAREDGTGAGGSQ